MKGAVIAIVFLIGAVCGDDAPYPPSGDAPYPPSGNAPYPPSGVKPKVLLVLPKYGPPTNDSATTASPQDQPDLEKVNESVMERLRQEVGSDRGVYYVYLPDGRLQRVQYTTAPLKKAPTQTTQQSSFQTNQQSNNQFVFGAHQTNTQGNSQGFNRYQSGETNRYQNFAPAEQYQQNYQYDGQSNNQYQQQAQYQTPSNNQYQQQAQYQTPSNNQYQQQAQYQSPSNNQYQQQSQYQTPSDNQYQAPSFAQFQAAQFAQYKQDSSAEYHGTSKVTKNNKEVEVAGDPSQILAKYVQPQPQAAAEVQSAKVQEEKSESPSYVASVQFTDVAPITGPIYSYNPSPLVRVVRYATNYQ